MVANPISPWSETRLAESFISNFIYSLRSYGAFNDAEITDISDVALILVTEVDRIVSKGIPSENKFKRLNTLFATSIADIIAADIGQTNRETKIICVERSLMDAFLKTTGTVDELFVKEIRKLINLFSKEKSRNNQMERQGTGALNGFSEHKSAQRTVTENDQNSYHSQVHQNGVSYFQKPDPRNYDRTNPTAISSNVGVHANEIDTERFLESSKLLVQPMYTIHGESSVLNNKEHNEYSFPNVLSEGENEIPLSQEEFRLNSDFNGSKQMLFSSESIPVKTTFIGQSENSNYDFVPGHVITSDELNFKRFSDSRDSASGLNQTFNPETFANENLVIKSDASNGLEAQNVDSNFNRNVYTPQEISPYGVRQGIKPIEDSEKYYLNQQWDESNLKPNFNQEFSQPFNINQDISKDDLKVNFSPDYEADNLKLGFDHEGKVNFDFNQDLSNGVISEQNFFNQDHIPRLFQEPNQLVLDDLNASKYFEASNSYVASQNQQSVAAELHNTSDATFNALGTQYNPHQNFKNYIADQESPTTLEIAENGMSELSSKEAFSSKKANAHVKQTYQTHQQVPAVPVPGDTSFVINSQQSFKQYHASTSPINLLTEQKNISDHVSNNPEAPSFALPHMPSENGVLSNSAVFSDNPVTFDRATESLSPVLTEKMKFHLNEDISKTPNFHSSSFINDDTAFANTQKENSSQYFSNQIGLELNDSANNVEQFNAGTFFQEDVYHPNSIHDIIPEHGIQGENAQKKNAGQAFVYQQEHQEWSNHLNNETNPLVSSAEAILPENVTNKNTDPTLVAEFGIQEYKLQPKFLGNAIEIQDIASKIMDTLIKELKRNRAQYSKLNAEEIERPFNQTQQITNLNVSESRELSQITSSDKSAYRKEQDDIEKKAFEKKHNIKANPDKVSFNAESNVKANGSNIASELYEDKNHKFTDVVISPAMGLSPEEINSIYQLPAQDGTEQYANGSSDAKSNFEKEIDVITGQIKELLLSKGDIFEKKPSQSLVFTVASKLSSGRTHAAIPPIINKLLINNSFSIDEIPNAFRFAYENAKNRDISQGHDALLLETLVDFSASLVHLLKFSTVGEIDLHDAVSTDNFVRDSLLKAFL